MEESDQPGSGRKQPYGKYRRYIAAYTCDKRNNGRSLQLEEQRSENREHQPGGTGIRLEQRRGSDHSQYNKRSVGAVYGDGVRENLLFKTRIKQRRLQMVMLLIIIL